MRFSGEPFQFRPCDRHGDEQSCCDGKENGEISAQFLKQRVLHPVFENSFPQLCGRDDDLAPPVFEKVQSDNDGGGGQRQKRALKSREREESHRFYGRSDSMYSLTN